MKIKSSLNKHESDIPTLDRAKIFDVFLLAREEVLKQLKNNERSKIKAIKPKLYNLFTQQLILIVAKTDVNTLLDDELDLIFKCEKQFVLRGNFKKVTIAEDNFIEDVDSYLAVSITLLRIYLLRKDVNALNSAIRMNDKACQLIQKNHYPTNIALAINAFQIEQNVINTLMEANNHV